jgi:hypothetical protein
MDWVTSFLHHHLRINTFHQVCAKMPPSPGVVRFNTPYSHVTQIDGNDMKPLGCVIVPVVVATLLHPSASQQIAFTDALLCFKNLVYFHCTAQHNYHTKTMIEYMENYLEDIHCHRDVFSRFYTSTSTKMVSESLKKQDSLGKQQ